MSAFEPDEHRVLADSSARRAFSGPQQGGVSAFLFSSLRPGVPFSVFYVEKLVSDFVTIWIVNFWRVEEKFTCYSSVSATCLVPVRCSMNTE